MELPGGSRRLDEAAKREIDRLIRRGVSVEVLADQFGLGASRIERVINEMRARRLLETKLEFMYDPSFDAPGAEAEILAPMPEPARAESPVGRAPRGAAALPGQPLRRARSRRASRSAHLFRKMNYLKYRASKLRERLDPARARAADLDEIERLQEEALAVKNQIIRANLRLVVSIAKKHVGPRNNFFELVSDGNMSLIRAVEKFDFARGNKFSTYATWAIMRNFFRSIPEENQRRDRFVTGHDEMFEAPPTPHRRARDRERPAAKPGDGRGPARPAQRPRAADPHQPLRPRGRRRSRPSSSSGRSWASPRSGSASSRREAQEKLRKIALEEQIDFLGL